jgi:hypothetical protein
VRERRKRASVQDGPTLRCSVPCKPQIAWPTTRMGANVSPAAAPIRPQVPSFGSYSFSLSHKLLWKENALPADTHRTGVKTEDFVTGKVRARTYTRPHIKSSSKSFARSIPRGRTRVPSSFLILKPLTYRLLTSITKYFMMSLSCDKFQGVLLMEKSF